jgi:Peptidase inhibitor family I36
MRRIATALIMVVSAVGTAMVMAQPALAGAHSTCSSGRVCLYENTDFNHGNTDHWADFTSSYSNFANGVWLNDQGSKTDDVMNDETSSIRNRRGCTATLWSNKNYAGDDAPIEPGESHDDGNLANNKVGDNRASSVRLSC